MFNNCWHKDRAIDTRVDVICIIELTEYNSISDFGTEMSRDGANKATQITNEQSNWVEASHSRQAKDSTTVVCTTVYCSVSKTIEANILFISYWLHSCSMPVPLMPLIPLMKSSPLRSSIAINCKFSLFCKRCQFSIGINSLVYYSILIQLIHSVIIFIQLFVCLQLSRKEVLIDSFGMTALLMKRGYIYNT